MDILIKLRKLVGKVEVNQFQGHVAPELDPNVKTTGPAGRTDLGQ